MSKKDKIVIIEDDASIREMYGLKLSEEGYEVHTAADGGDGLILVRQIKPDLVLLDLTMPGVSGVTFLDLLRKADDQTKVVILTNIEDEAVRKSVTAKHISDYIVKAEVTPTQVAERIKALL